MLPNLGETDGKFNAEFQLAAFVIDGHVLQSTEDELVLIIAAINANPHPLANARDFVRELYFDVVTLFVFVHLEAPRVLSRHLNTHKHSSIFVG